jgi:xanthine dehydrogenase iron-sulfur cluster and FAD-binding subunit A
MINFRLNNKEVTYSGNLSECLLDVLRNEYKLTGTKCGCKEGECGACSVIVNGRLINSCLVAMGSLNNCDVLTIEGYSKSARFAALDKAYASVSAVQCGFCIPGMILASECILSEHQHPTDEDIREGISGNICRCTGYNSIVRAIELAAEDQVQNFRMSYPTIREVDLEEYVPKVAENTDNSYSADFPNSLPKTLREALVMRRKYDLIPYSGGTDLMVEENSDEKDYLFIGNLLELKNIIEDEKFIRFGAGATFYEVLNHKLTPAILKEACKQIAAPAIRNTGTVGGNIANGSAKADSALIFMVTDSKIRLASSDSERIIPISDFYLGGGKTALKNDELIIEILMPKHGIENYCYTKIGARNALAISRVSFAGIADIQDGIIKNYAVAFGAVIDTIIRRSDIDIMMIGKTIEEAKLIVDDYIDAYDEAIVPRRGRVGVEYRKDVCMNLLRDFIANTIC